MQVKLRTDLVIDPAFMEPEPERGERGEPGLSIKGDRGDNGKPGADGKGFNLRGAWRRGTYEPLDVVHV
jgi:hypothetical protein